MQGLHLTADLWECVPATPAMVDPDCLRALCLRAVGAAGLHAVAEVFHRFPGPGGITGVVLLAESHLAVHTWPEQGAVTLDVYVCNLHEDNRTKARALLDDLLQAFAPGRQDIRQIQRGIGPATTLPA